MDNDEDSRRVGGVLRTMKSCVRVQQAQRNGLVDNVTVYSLEEELSEDSVRVALRELETHFGFSWK
jgi:hypothetical protein